MKEFILTQSYQSIDEMLNSGEMYVYKEELQTSEVKEYAIVSRIGNRYDIYGNKIVGYAYNPFIVEEKNKTLEVNKMKYVEIEALIDKEIENAIADVTKKYEKDIEELKSKYEIEISKAKELAKEEILAKIRD